MDQQNSSFERIMLIAKGRLWNSMVASVFVSWGFLILLNSNPFSLITDDTSLPIMFFVLLTGILGVLFFFGRRRLCSRGALSERLLGTTSYLCAAAACLLFGLAIAYGFSAIAAITCAAVLSAAAFACFALRFFIRYCDADMLETAVESALSFAFGTVILFVSIFLLSGSGLMYCYAIMLLFCGIGIWRDQSRRLSSAEEFAEEGRDGSTGKAGKRDGSWPQAVRPMLFKLVFFLIGVFLAYEFNGTQKTLHFVGVHVFPIHLGGTALTAIEYLAIVLALLFVMVVSFAKSNVVLPSIAAAVVMAASFFTLPTLERLPFPFLAACATILLFVAWLFLFRILHVMPKKEDRTRLFCTNMALLSFGGLLGSLLALFVLEFLDTESQAGFFIGFQGALLLTIVIVLIVFSKDILVLFRRKSASNDLDSSKLKDRCDVLTARYGLTKRESEILELMVRGRNVPSIAEELVVSKSTVKSHVLQTYRKAGVSSRQELLDIVYSEGDLF